MLIDLPFVFWRVVRFFGTSPVELLNTPVRLFWSMCCHVDKISALEDLRNFQVAQAAQATQEGAQRFVTDLREAAGTPIHHEKPASSRQEILTFIEAAPL